MGVTDPNVCYRAPEFIERPTVYFNCSDGTDSEPRPVQRDLATDLPTETAVEQVFAEMLQGPTLAEREASYWSSFSEETADALLSITYQEETQGLVMDFTEAILVNNASTSTGSQFFLGELLANAFQFEEVRSVEFRVNGSCEAFWEFLQAGPICNVIDKP
jgi:spore germination protein GerM